MADPFTIRIFVPDGDPDGIRIIDRMNWTGLGVAFPRTHWDKVRLRPEIQRTGVYILVGYSEEDEDLQKIYVGQADGVASRLESHVAKKDFWTWGVAFVSNSGGLNRAHVTWLEHELVRRALEAKRCRLDNGNAPTEPALSEAEKADTRAFMKEILQILPLVGLRVFEVPVPVVVPAASGSFPTIGSQLDTVIVPAQRDGFQEVFLGDHEWHAIRISGGMLPHIKYIAAYQTQPVSAVTHVAQVARIEPYGDTGKYRLVFAEPAREITPIPFGNAPSGAMQGPRYTSYIRLQSARSLADLLAR